MIRSISPKTTQGDMLALLEHAGVRMTSPARTRRTATSKASNVVHVDFNRPSAVAFLRMYCAMTKERA